MQMPFNWPTLSLGNADRSPSPANEAHEALDPYFLGVFAEHAFVDRRHSDSQQNTGEPLAGSGLGGMTQAQGDRSRR